MFVRGKWGLLSDRLVSNFIVRQMSFFFGAAVIIGLRHRCSSMVKPAVSPFNTLTLMSVAECQSPDMTPAVSSLCQEGDMQDSGLSPRGADERLIAKDVVDLHVEGKYFAKAINCSLAVMDQRCRRDIFWRILCAVTRVMSCEWLQECCACSYCVPFNWCLLPHFRSALSRAAGLWWKSEVGFVTR